MLAALPREVRSLVFHHPPAFSSARLLAVRRASFWSRPAFFTRAPSYPPIVLRPSAALWALPILGGLAIYLVPSTEPILPPGLFESPTLIPCSPDPPPSAPSETFILSPSEHELTISGRIVSILRDSIWEPLLTATRFIHLCFLFIPVIATSPMLLVGRYDSKLDGERWGAIWWYGFLIRQMESAGPTFIKLSQWAATRADLFPNVLCDRFRKMHSSSKPHSLAHTKRVIERVFRRPFAEVFEEFDETPIGTGAIAQVYRATLKHDLLPPSYFDPKRTLKHGSPVIAPSIVPEPRPAVPTAAVAIKVLHPRVDKMIARDLSIMSFFAHAITLIPGMEWISLPEEVEVFGRMMYEQINLQTEADHLATFERNFMGRKEPIFFPRPLHVWSSRDLLIEEYQHALPLNAFLKNGAGPFSDQLAELGLDAFLKMLLLDNFVHADLHPGNIFVKFYKPSTTDLLRDVWRSFFDPSASLAQASTPASDNAETNALVSQLRDLTHDKQRWAAELQSIDAQGYLPELIFIDAGLVTTLSARNRTNFVDLFRAVAEFDGYRTGQLMVARSRAPELAVDPETFALKMQHIVLNVKRKTFSLGQIKISDILTDVLRAVRAHHVKMEGDFVNTVISILLLEGIGRQLDPGLDLFKSALPILRQLGRQMTTQGDIKRLPEELEGSLSFFKLWVWLEARELATAALVNADEMVRYDWLTPNI